MERDIFDKIMGLPGLRILEPFYQKHKEILLYLFFGGLTFLVSIASYGYCNLVLGINELVANVISWILAVSFAFLTNRIWVFQAPTHSAAEFVAQLVTFFGGRVVTLVVEEVLLLVFITWLHFPSMLIKILAQVIVIVLNYVISKLVVFRKKGQ